jgi:hypothetical protein
MPDEPTGTPAEGAPAPDTSSSSPEWAPVLDRVGELASTVGELQSGFQSFVQANQPPPEPEPDPWAALFPQEAEQDPEMYQQAQQPQLDPGTLQQAFQQAVQQANAPLQQQIQQMQLQAATQQLYERIPQLAPTAENAQVREATYERVNQSLQQYPPEIAQVLGNDPRYIETIFKAAEAEKLAQGQAPTREQTPAVEAAGGAVPGGNGEQPNPVHQVFASRGQGLPQGFG